MDTVHIGKKRHHIPVLLEVDVTDARAAITKRTKEAGETVSFTGWVVKCLAQAAGEHKRVHARRLRRSKLVLFDDVDVALAVYRHVTDDDSGERLPMPFVIRKANEKSLVQISDEIQTAQSLRLAAGQQWLDPQGKAPAPWLWRLFFFLPRFLRLWLVWNPLLHNPYRAKRMTGTVMVTSVAMFGKSSAWAIPAGIHPLLVALGGVARKPGIVEDRVEPRDLLSMTVLFDHDVVDGVPVALFLKRLVKLMESAFFLDT